MTPLEKREMWITPMQEFYAAFRHRLQQAGWDTAWSDKLFEQFEDDINALFPEDAPDDESPTRKQLEKLQLLRKETLSILHAWVPPPPPDK